MGSDNASRCFPGLSSADTETEHTGHTLAFKVPSVSSCRHAVTSFLYNLPEPAPSVPRQFCGGQRACPEPLRPQGRVPSLAGRVAGKQLVPGRAPFPVALHPTRPGCEGPAPWGSLRHVPAPEPPGCPPRPFSELHRSLFLGSAAAALSPEGVALKGAQVSVQLPLLQSRLPWGPAAATSRWQFIRPLVTQP